LSLENGEEEQVYYILLSVEPEVFNYLSVGPGDSLRFFYLFLISSLGIQGHLSNILNFYRRI